MKHVVVPFLLLGLFFVAVICRAQEMPADEALSFIARTDKLMSPAEYESWMVMTNYKPGRQPTKNRTHVYRREDKMVAIFLDPPIQKGEAFIRSGDDMWMYLPRSKKVTRIGAKETSMGGEASNADLMRVDLARDYTAVSAVTEDVSGRASWKIELKARDRSISYDRIICWIDKDSGIPSRREYYALSGRKMKTMTFSDVRMLGSRQRPGAMLIVNEDNPEYRTEMVVETLKEGLAQGDQIFTPSYVQQGLLR
jgi:outer membrane lipoprotein-sorting protein